ncbi:hypothetical protein [Gryllotalpicola ginsengisoli]|uniref:hypothetical protein n=1 Tax=Gryllotalpicola ginsengisoli TaxID=444608 RepID=UPI0003B47D4A|nr:hypothetical protein [Gryllotalpicola ginsengisoli]
MAEPRGVAHVSRDLVNKLVGIITDPALAPQRKLDQATATLDRLIDEADSPAASVRHAVVGVLDDALSAATEQARAGTPRHDVERMVRAKVLDGLRELPGVSVEGLR